MDYTDVAPFHITSCLEHFYAVQILWVVQVVLATQGPGQ
ncbi:MAG: hypothetical protein K0S38_901 [Candidatus Paceibacter sp.]|jgi:hypothetical protein|nr:hypothetical protein [Candidatus Paceibacter sp.]